MGDDAARTARNLERALRERGKKTVPFEAICQLLGTRNRTVVSEALEPLLSSGALSPIARSGYVDRALGLKERYRLAAEQSSTADEVRQRSRSLAPELWGNAALVQHADEALARWELVGRLSGWLAATRGDGIFELTLRERSLEIFGDEKFLQDDALGRAIAANLGQRLHVLPHPPVLPCYVSPLHPGAGGWCLVSENLDPFLDLRELMRAGAVPNVDGRDVTALVYGSGKAAASPGALQDCMADAGIAGCGVLYWGDIDRAGIAIASSVAGRVPGAGLAAGLYAKMLELACGRSERSDDGVTDMPDLDAVSAAGIDAAAVAAILGPRRLLPQEVLNRRVLFDMFGGGAS